MGGYKLPKHKTMSMKKLEIYDNPKKLYYNVKDNYNILVKTGDYVLRGDVIARRNNSFETPIFSSVSGVVLEAKDTIVIENDLKEKSSFKKHKVDNKEDFIKLLKDCGIVGMGGAGFPTYFKYQTDVKVDTLLINAVECEPYITADYTIIMEKIEDILDTINKILEINNITKAVFAIKVSNSEAIGEINKYIENYPKIILKIVPNLYPMGWERTLIKEALNLEYDRLPIEKGIIVNNVSTIFAIHEAMKSGKPLLERIVTISGEGVKKPRNYYVKIGTKVSEFMGPKDKDTVIVKGGPMMGTLADKDLSVTADLNCVLVLPKKKEGCTKNCLRCAKCVSVCPAGLVPVLIKDNVKNKETLIKLHPERCIGCGLCSYICPSNIDVREKVNQAKMEVK